MPDSRRSIPLRPTAPALSEREQSILRLVVQRFVQTAAPVGSRVISEEDEIVLSSASLRNTMSRLEALGYLGHPHTSAGRVPTELGYRFYVDSLMNVAGLTPGDEAILRQSLDALYGDIEALTRTSSRLLGQLSQLLGVVLTPKLATGTLDRIDVVPLSSSRVMFVLEVRGGLVRTIIAEADAEIRRSDLPRLVTLLNERLAGLSLGEIRKTGAARLDEGLQLLDGPVPLACVPDDRREAGVVAAQRDHGDVDVLGRRQLEHRMVPESLIGIVRVLELRIAEVLRLCAGRTEDRDVGVEARVRAAQQRKATRGPVEAGDVAAVGGGGVLPLAVPVIGTLADAVGVEVPDDAERPVLCVGGVGLGHCGRGRGHRRHDEDDGRKSGTVAESGALAGGDRRGWLHRHQVSSGGARQQERRAAAGSTARGVAPPSQRAHPPRVRPSDTDRRTGDGRRARATVVSDGGDRRRPGRDRRDHRRFRSGDGYDLR